LSEEVRKSLKHAHAGVAVAAVLSVIDVLVFHDNGSAMTTGGALALVIGMVTMLVLDEREYRARHPKDRRSD
jgi:K+ transporter